jgi:hypothetical protein
MKPFHEVIDSRAHMPRQPSAGAGPVSEWRRVETVAVGMPVTRHPPHRSRRAGLPHRALASGNNAETHQRVRMADTRQGNPPGNQALHPSPRQVVLLAAAP